MDAEVIATIGRNHVVNELLEAGVDVAMPVRSSGIALIAYAELKDTVAIAPLAIRASSGKSFAIDQKLEKVPNLIHVFVWGIGSAGRPATYALTHREALGVADAMGYTITQAWQRGLYNTQQPSRSLVEHLERYRMSSDAWKAKIAASTG